MSLISAELEILQQAMKTSDFLCCFGNGEKTLVSFLTQVKMPFNKIFVNKIDFNFVILFFQNLHFFFFEVGNQSTIIAY